MIGEPFFVKTFPRKMKLTSSLSIMTFCSFFFLPNLRCEKREQKCFWLCSVLARMLLGAQSFTKLQFPFGSQNIFTASSSCFNSTTISTSFFSKQSNRSQCYHSSSCVGETREWGHTQKID